jgi:signal peptidase II
MSAYERVRDVVRWSMFAGYLFGFACVVWPFYVVRNLPRLLLGCPRFSIGLVLIGLDQAIKTWAHLDLARRNGPITVIDGFLDLRYAQNVGAAFSILPGQTFVLVLMAVLTVVIVVLYTAISQEEEPLTKAGLLLILSGAIGNMIDRVIHQYVIDYVHVFWGSWDRWPIFNLADALIDIGVGLLAIDFFLDALGSSDESQAAKDDRPKADQ